MTGVREEMRLQREQSEMYHRDLKSSLDRMEERAVAAEKRTEMSEKRTKEESAARARAEKKVEKLLQTIESIRNTKLIKNQK